jgi:hypothetical protein
MIKNYLVQLLKEYERYYSSDTPRYLAVPLEIKENEK